MRATEEELAFSGRSRISPLSWLTLHLEFGSVKVGEDGSMFVEGKSVCQSWGTNERQFKDYDAISEEGWMSVKSKWFKEQKRRPG